MKNEGASTAAGNTCATCGSKFPTIDALVVHQTSAHPKHAGGGPRQDEALSYAPGGTVADYETGPRPGGKMDRETSRPAKGWETPGEEGEPRKGLRNQGVAPIEAPDPVAEESLSEKEPPQDPEEHSTSRKPHKKSAEGG
jgi:hypothetical protein